MRERGRFAAYTAIGMVAVLLLASCGSDKKDSTTATTTAGGPQTINGCVIQPGTSCPGGNLSGQNLQGVNLTGANLATANLSKANFSNANLSGTNLTGANLTGVIMAKTNLSGANLTNADFSGGDLENVNLTNATHCGTIRTDGSIDNVSCPKSPPPTSQTPRTTTAVTPPTCDTATLMKVLTAAGESPTANGSPTCEGKYAALPIKLPTDNKDQIALFRVAADSDTWINWAIVTVGTLPVSIEESCSSLPSKIAALIGCPSG